MRYLNYIIGPNSERIELTLSHPEDLVSVSTLRVKILNMNKCINLRNIFSWENIYKSDDIVPLKNLRRIYSNFDYYQQNDNCFLHNLLRNNKLEYVYVNNQMSFSNVVNSFVIQDNIENLRFMHVYFYSGVYDIKLNIK